MDKTYDAIIIGSGQGGNPLAKAFAHAGKKTLLVEQDVVGGTCINRGCTPTKTLVASAKVAFQTKRSALFGVNSSFQGVNFPKIIAHKQKIVETFRNSGEQGLKTTAGLDLVFGKASFVDPSKISVDGKTTSAPLIVINTGARPMLPPIQGLDTIPYLDSTSIMELETLPKHLIILGSSYIALEFGQMFRRFGSEVTVLARSERLITREDPEVSEALREILEKDGIRFLFDVDVQAVAKNGNDIQVQFGSETLDGSHLLVATGRTPNTEELQLEKAGVTKDKRGFIEVNETLQSSVSHIYAIGDVKGGPAFTHISYDDYRILRDNLLEGKTRSTQNRAVPYTMYTDPQLGRIGLSEEEAKKANLPYKVAKIPMSYVARAIELQEDAGLMKAIVHATTGEILGCAVLGLEGGELMSMIQIAMMGKLSYTQLANATFAHPSLAEALNTLFSID